MLQEHQRHWEMQQISHYRVYGEISGLEVRVLPGSPVTSSKCFSSHQFGRPPGVTADAELRTKPLLLAQPRFFASQRPCGCTRSASSQDSSDQSKGLSGLKSFAVCMQERVTERIPRDAWLFDPIARGRELSVVQVFIAGT